MRAPSTSTVFFASGVSVIGSPDRSESAREHAAQSDLTQTIERQPRSRSFYRRPTDNGLHDVRSLHDFRPAAVPGVFRYGGRANLAGVVEAGQLSARPYLRPAA